MNQKQATIKIVDKVKQKTKLAKTNQITKEATRQALKKVKPTPTNYWKKQMYQNPKTRLLEPERAN